MSDPSSSSTRFDAAAHLQGQILAELKALREDVRALRAVADRTARAHAETVVRVSGVRSDVTDLQARLRLLEDERHQARGALAASRWIVGILWAVAGAAVVSGIKWVAERGEAGG